MNFFSVLSNKTTHYNKFITNAIIAKINNNYTVQLIKNGENDTIIDNINNKLEIFDKLFTSNIEDISNINNKNIKEKINELDKKYKEEISILKLKIKKYEENYDDELNKYIKNHNNVQEEKYKLSVELEKNKIKDNFYNEIKKKDMEIIQLNQELSKLTDLTSLEKTLNTKFNAFNKYFDNKISTQVKGSAGEEHLLTYIKKHIDMSNGYIEKVSGEANAGDLFMVYNNMKCCIESKNHSSTIPSKEINRFLYTDLQNPRYNCGLFISHFSGFPNSSGIKHFQIKIENNKPCIFLSNIQNNLNDIQLSIKVLNFLLTIDYNVDKINVVNQLKQDLTTFKELEDIANQNIKNLNKSCKIIENKYAEIEKIIKINSVYKGKKRKYN